MVMVDGKCGYSDKGRNMVIAAQYDKAGDLHEGLAYVEMGVKRLHRRDGQPGHRNTSPGAGPC